jgi:hypothetical protein
MIRFAENLRGLFAMDAHSTRHSERFMLWIDAVGGYWVCLGDDVKFGQPDGSRELDVPILGDLSSRHARICRDGDGYLVEAMHETKIDGQPVQHIGWLHDKNLIELGRSVQLMFRRPHALSGTARLEFVSRHRTQPSADAVLLMADTCVLGPRLNCHVVCRHWTQEVILYRHQNTLYCRTPGEFKVDGVVCHDCAPITTHSRVQGNGFSFCLEAMIGEGARSMRPR